MRVAVVYVPAGRPDALAALAKSLAAAFEAAGHRAELFEPGSPLNRLPAFDYVAFGTEAASLGGKIPPRIKDLLAQAVGLQGKRSLAFVRKSGLRPAKTLSRLMAVMEAEGMYVNDSEILGTGEEAAAAARAAPVERK